MSWAGQRATNARARIAATLPARCEVCGLTIHPGDAWQVGHRIPRTVRPDLTWDPANHRPEHTACNLAGGARITNARRRGGITPGWRTVSM